MSFGILLKKILGVHYDPGQAIDFPVAPSLEKVEMETDCNMRYTTGMGIANLHNDTDDGFEAVINKGKPVAKLNEETEKKLVADRGIKWETYLQVKAFYKQGLTAKETEKMFKVNGKTKRGFSLRNIENIWPILTGSAIVEQKNRNRVQLRKLKLKINNL